MGTRGHGKRSVQLTGTGRKLAHAVHVDLHRGDRARVVGRSGNDVDRRGDRGIIRRRANSHRRTGRTQCARGLCMSRDRECKKEQPE